MRDLGVKQWVGVGAVLALLGCSGGSDDSPAVGSGAGGALAGGSGGSLANGGSNPNGGSVTNGGAAANGGGSGGVLAGAGGGGGTGGAPLKPLAAADDPSRISQLADCAVAKGGACVTPLSRTKAEVCTRWTSDWPKHAPSGYTVSADVCGPAPLNAEASLDALRRVNLYRWLSALSPVAQSSEWTAPAEACAVIQAHLPAFNHYPPATSACYTELGGKASSESLLAPGEFTPADAIDDLIYDWGANNLHVLGHRWWLLSPGLEKLGLGFAYPSDGKRSTCVRVNDGSGMDRPDGLAGVVAYPSFGRVPFESIDRESWARPLSDSLEWSVSFPYDTDLSALSVRVYQQSAEGYDPLKVTFGSNADFDTAWIDMPKDPMPPGTYIVLISGTGVGDFGYRTVIDRCGTDAPLSCDVVGQDCGLAGYGCYGSRAAGFCTKAGGLPIGQPCLGNLPAECVAGAACVEAHNASGAFVCAEYCDPDVGASVKACSSYCNGDYVLTSSNQSGDKLSAYCMPHDGPVCDPLMPQCPTGQACYESACATVGTVKKGQSCQFANDCESSLTCLFDSTGSFTCQPYCDPKSASSANACAVLCPNHFTHLEETLGVCLP